MLRYFLISAAIVVGGTMLVAAWVDRDLIRLKLASVYVRVPPKPERALGLAPPSARPLSIEAPWALSVLPACLIQMSDTTGPAAYVLAHLPPGAQAIAPPASLTYGNCTILVRGDEAYVRRGDDRFHIPPRIQFFRAGGALALLRRDGPGMDLRIYQPPPH
jgi:hypothetical protein